MLQHLATMDFDERRSLGPVAGLAFPRGSLDEVDPIVQMAQADAADRSLLRLVLCAAGATLMLALVTSLV